MDHMDHTITTNHIISNDISADDQWTTEPNRITELTEPVRYPDDGQILSQIAASNIDFKNNQFTATFLTTT